MKYVRMPIEIESPEQLGYATIKCNLTESSCTDVIMKDLNLDMKDLVICYGDHAGKKELRELIAKESGGQITADDVLVTAGAATALFIVSTTLLEKGDRLLVIRPNYATNIETPRAIGAKIDFYDLSFEEGFRIDPKTLESKILPDTKFVSLTSPHNPTGTMMSAQDLKTVADVCARKNVKLLFDETYREMAFDNVLPVGASVADHVISVSSLSKTYGLPGIRIGWLITRDKKLMETFLAAKEQIMICNSVVDEEIAYRFIREKNKKLPGIKSHIRNHFEIVKKWIQSEKRLEWIEPKGGVVCFPRISASSGVNVEKFYKVLNDKYSTHVGPGHWFEQDRKFMRIGFGWPKTAELEEGLANISKALTDASK